MADLQFTSRRDKSRSIRTGKCSICQFPSSRFDPARRTVIGRRGNQMIVCGMCRAKYSHIVSQLAWCGLRYRFVERHEIPRGPARYRAAFPRIYKLLLLAKERQILLRKEVNWMPEETARKILNFPKRVAEAMKGTYAICGDDATVPEDVALLKIKDLLEELDPNIFRDLRRRQKKRLS
jgi:hypothetical protein